MQSSAPTNQPTLIVGLGKTGESCARFLQEQGKKVVVVDTRLNPPGLLALQKDYPHLPIKLGPFDQRDFENVAEIIISPGVAQSTPEIKAAQDRGIACYGDIDLFMQYAQAPIIAVTGSNGKSTVVTLITAMLTASGCEVALAGNIGIPVLELVRQDAPDYYVLELSSFQLETTSKLNAAVSLVLNVSEDHMDRYASFEEYCQAKARIYQGDGLIVVANDDEEIKKLIPLNRKIIGYGSTGDTHSEGESLFTVVNKNDKTWLVYGREYLLEQSQLKVQGRHNMMNIAASMTVCNLLGASIKSMCEAAKNFKGLAHRTQFVAEHNQVRWINDSKGTNVGATVAALKGLGAKVVLIAGGEAKDADFSELTPVLAEVARGLILIGKDADLIARAVEKKLTPLFAANLADAVAKADHLAQPGDVVLFSPACASFDMFVNFEDRGNQFIAAVEEYYRTQRDRD